MIVELQEISKVIMGQSPKGESYNVEKIGLPLLNGAADYKAKVFKPKYYTSEPTRTAKKGDILLGVRATIGNFTFSDNEYCIGRGVAAIRVDENKADKSYVIKCVEKGLNEIIHTLSGSTIKGIRKEDLTEMKLNLPPLPQQQKIANILDAADAVRQNDKALIAKYDELTQALFLDMFGDPVSNPKGWSEKSLNDLCTKITDGTHDTPLRLTEGIKFITGKHIRPFVIDYHNSDYVTEEVHNEIYRRCNPEYGDILYTNIGVNFATAAMNTVDYEFSMKNVALLKYKREFLNGRFLESILNNGFFKDRLKRVFGIGGAQQFLSLSNIKSIMILNPPLELQNQFAERVVVIEEQKAIAQKSLEKSENLFNSLLQKAFKGELV
jgi:type I restriction enzyme S subunit